MSMFLRLSVSRPLLFEPQRTQEVNEVRANDPRVPPILQVRMTSGEQVDPPSRVKI